MAQTMNRARLKLLESLREQVTTEANGQCND
jgi:hypothetical protein